MKFIEFQGAELKLSSFCFDFAFFFCCNNEIEHVNRGRCPKMSSLKAEMLTGKLLKENRSVLVYHENGRSKQSNSTILR